MKTFLLFLIMCMATVSISAQAKPCKNKSAQQTAQYTCPMHPDVANAQPGKCPKCGKKTEVTVKEPARTDILKILTCRSHPDVVLDKDGNCYECAKASSIKIYTCRMHPDVVLDKDGNCYECAKTASAKGF